MTRRLLSQSTLLLFGALTAACGGAAPPGNFAPQQQAEKTEIEAEFTGPPTKNEAEPQ